MSSRVIMVSSRAGIEMSEITHEEYVGINRDNSESSDSAFDTRRNTGQRKEVTTTENDSKTQTRKKKSKKKLEKVCTMYTQLHQVIEAQKWEINLLRDTITAAKSDIGISLDQYDAIHEDVNK